MELIRCRHNLRQKHHGCVIAIGNFDGVHRGHQAIIEQLQRAASVMHLPVTVMLFEPQPQEYFAPDKAPPRLMRLRDKVQCLREYGVDRVICLRFDSDLANLAPESFVNGILADELGVKYVAVGNDFRFGKDRRGDIDLLERVGRKRGFNVVCASIARFRGRRVSSSWVRDLLQAGNLSQAAALMGHPFIISGRVIHGEKRGRELGYPTINIDLQRLQSPVAGIFVSRVHDLGATPIDAVTSIGTRPVFKGRQMLLESHLLDFNKQVYGRHIRVELLAQLRQEKNFTDVESLRKQIGNDIAAARRWLNQTY